MKKNTLPFFVFVCILCSACVSTRQPKEEVLRPKWLSIQGRQELFPDSEYISSISYGYNEQECKEKASVGVSEYIKSSVVSSANAEYFYQESGNNFIENKKLHQIIQVSTANNLWQLEYTNPYFDEVSGQFACVAYINREKAFNFVRPKMEIAEKQFPQAYYNSLQKDYLLDKIIGIRHSWSVLPDFYEVYDFARAIMPERAKAYEEVDALAKESVLSFKELCTSVLIKIQGTGDIVLLENSGVIAELSNQLANMGFAVGNSQKANCIALVEVKSAITETRETFQAYPEISIKILEKGKEKITYTKKLSKVAGFDKETVIRRTNIALTEDIKNSFVNECF